MKMFHKKWQDKRMLSNVVKRDCKDRGDFYGTLVSKIDIFGRVPLGRSAARTDARFTKTGVLKLTCMLLSTCITKV